MGNRHHGIEHGFGPIGCESRFLADSCEKPSASSAAMITRAPKKVILDVQAFLVRKFEQFTKDPRIEIGGKCKSQLIGVPLG